MRHRRPISVAVVAMFALALSACGGQGDEGATPAETPSPEIEAPVGDAPLSEDEWAAAWVCRLNYLGGSDPDDPSQDWVMALDSLFESINRDPGRALATAEDQNAAVIACLRRADLVDELFTWHEFEHIRDGGCPSPRSGENADANPNCWLFLGRVAGEMEVEELIAFVDAQVTNSRSTFRTSVLEGGQVFEYVWALNPDHIPGDRMLPSGIAFDDDAVSRCQISPLS